MAGGGRITAMQLEGRGSRAAHSPFLHALIGFRFTSVEGPVPSAMFISERPTVCQLWNHVSTFAARHPIGIHSPWLARTTTFLGQPADPTG